jgi:hypothetical protein
MYTFYRVMPPLQHSGSHISLSTYYTVIHHSKPYQRKEAVYIILARIHLTPPSYYRCLIPAFSILLVATSRAGPRIRRAATGCPAAALELEAEGVLVAGASLAVLATALAVLRDGLAGRGSWGRGGGAWGRAGGLDRGGECSGVSGG